MLNVATYGSEEATAVTSITGATFVSELPKTASGKIQKVVLRNDYWEAAGKGGKFVN